MPRYFSIIKMKYFIIFLFLIVNSVFATTYPTRTITLIVPYPAGGVGDVVGRVIANELSAELGKPIVVENKIGAAGNIGTGAVAKMKPDGYSLLLGYAGTLGANPYLFKNIQFNTLQDFTPISKLVEVPLMFFIRTTLPINSMKEFVEYARTHPDLLTYGGGIGTAGHLGLVSFALRNDLKLRFIPHKGSGQAAIELAAGRIDFMLDSPNNVGAFVKEGKVRALAIALPLRDQNYPDVPTAAESGYPNLTPLTSWFGLFAPHGVPSDIATLLNEKIRVIMARPDIIERMRKAGLSPSISLSSDAFLNALKLEIPLWGEVIKASGLEPQ